jgi:serine/threonine protein kinase
MPSSALPPPRADIPATPSVQAADVTEKYELFDKEEKGKGAFSRVVVGTCKKTGEPRAVKIMERHILTGKKGQMVAHEKEILRRTNHPNIIKLHECLTTPTRVYMIMDLMQGDLFDFIVKRKRVPEVTASKIMAQLLSAVDYLHYNSVIHRDIKPENILIDDDDNIRLADFGLAKVIQEWNVKSTPCGTSFYIAPEIIRGIEENGARPLCTTKEDVKFVDIWSCGVVLFVMLAGRPPFYGQVSSSADRRALLAKIDKGLLFPDAQWAHISPDAKDLCARMLSQDSTQRVSAAEALKHPFIKSQVLASELGATAADNEDAKTLVGGVNEVQNEVREAGDTEGDESSYSVAQAAPAPAAPKVTMIKKVPGLKK